MHTIKRSYQPTLLHPHVSSVWCRARCPPADSRRPTRLSCVVLIWQASNTLPFALIAPSLPASTYRSCSADREVNRRSNQLPIHLSRIVRINSATRRIGLATPNIAITYKFKLLVLGCATKVVAERVGFEPTEGDKPSLVFKTSALNHSATSPNRQS
jgi:hypothetical protein